jgi:signal transduction histidine kinase
MAKYYEIVIKDNGIGFDQQFEERIFVMFQRLHGRTDFPGTGIGLALCKKIVENHAGIIKATGEENKGATFTILLPVKKN